MMTFFIKMKRSRKGNPNLGVHFRERMSGLKTTHFIDMKKMTLGHFSHVTSQPFLVSQKNDSWEFSWHLTFNVSTCDKFSKLCHHSNIQIWQIFKMTWISAHSTFQYVISQVRNCHCDIFWKTSYLSFLSPYLCLQISTSTFTSKDDNIYFNVNDKMFFRSFDSGCHPFYQLLRSFILQIKQYIVWQ